MVLLPFLAKLRITQSWSSWRITGKNLEDKFIGIWSYEGVALAHILFLGLYFLATLY